MLIRRARETGETPNSDIEASMTSKPEGTADSSLDVRTQALNAVAQAMQLVGWPRPTVVVSVLPPFYAAYAMALDPEAQTALTILREFAREWRGSFPLRQRNFYPYISDMSFVRTVKSEHFKSLLKQMPLPAIREISSLSRNLCIPVVNLGPWGKGAHTVRERVHINFLTQELPEMYLSLLSRLIGCEISL